MNILFFLKKKFQGSFIDKFVRYTLNYFSRYYYKSSKKIKRIDSQNLVFVCYGGLGDCILMLPLINGLSLKYPVTIFLEKKFKDLTYLLNKNVKVINYEKHNILNELKIFRSTNLEYVLIQQTPIMEFMLFHFYLKRPPIIGFIYKQNLVSSEGFDLKDYKMTSINKIIKYKKLLDILVPNSSKKTHNSKKIYIKNNFVNLKSNFIPRVKYFLLSPTKNHNWEMGFLDFKVYSNFISNVYFKYKLIPVIIGTNEDNRIIKKIIENIPKKIFFYNLVGQTKIKDIFSLILNAKFVVANDNGIHHLSNFLNMRTLTLYNFSSSKVW